MQAGGPPSCTTADRSAGTQATTLAAGYHRCCGMGPVRCTTAQKSATPMQAVHHSLQQHARVYCAVQQRHTQTHAAERETQAQTHSPQHCTHTDTHRGRWHTRATGTPVTSRGRTKTRTRNNTAAAALRSSLVSHSCPAIGTFSLPRHIYIPYATLQQPHTCHKTAASAAAAQTRFENCTATAATQGTACTLVVWD